MALLSRGETVKGFFAKIAAGRAPEMRLCGLTRRTVGLFFT